MTPTMTPSVATEGLSTAITALIIIVALMSVALAMVVVGIVLFQTLRRKAVRGKQPAPATGYDTFYDEIDEGQTSTAVALTSVGKLQTITDPDPLYEAMDDSELVSQFESSLNVPTASSEFSVTGILPSDDVPTLQEQKGCFNPVVVTSVAVLNCYPIKRRELEGIAGNHNYACMWKTSSECACM